MRELLKRWCILVITISTVLSLGNQGRQTRAKFFLRNLGREIRLRNEDQLVYQQPSSLGYDFYRDKCPQAEQIIRSTVRKLYTVRHDLAPALLRLVFHDCFIHGCDASVLLDSIDGEKSEKEAVPNSSLKGFDLIEIIKSELEAVCPATVSCSDVLVLAARESVFLAGGPFYPLQTGRRDSIRSFYEDAQADLPSPRISIDGTLSSFSRRGFNQREIVSLFGAHSIGTVHCRFILDRVYNFDHSGMPDPTLDTGLLHFMRDRCMNISGSLNSETGLEFDYEMPHSSFDGHYYRRLLQGKGILHADQQLMANEQTARLVQVYASGDGYSFRRDFARSMMKLSDLGVLSASHGQIRLTCSCIVM